MFGQRILDQLRIDVVPAPDDQFLAPTGEPEIAVRILPPEIAGIETARAFNIDPQIPVVLRIEIACEDVGPLDGDRSDLVDVRHP